MPSVLLIYMFPVIVFIGLTFFSFYEVHFQCVGLSLESRHSLYGWFLAGLVLPLWDILAKHFLMDRLQVLASTNSHMLTLSLGHGA